MDWQNIHIQALTVIRDTNKVRLSKEERADLESAHHKLVMVKELCRELDNIIMDKIVYKPKKVTK